MTESSADPLRRTGLVLRSALIIAALSVSSLASAQRFRDVAADAQDLPGDVSEFGAAYFASCDSPGCRRVQRRDIRALQRQKWLVSVPATGHVELGPYETVREGFLVRVPTVVLSMSGGRMSTHAPMADGSFPREVLGENFLAVPPRHAERWLARNAPERLRLRMVVELESRFEPHGEPSDVVRIRSHGIQVYNASTGDVLLDSLAATPDVLPGPPDLDERALLWDRSTMREARWRTAQGRPLLFSVRVEPGEGDALRPILLVRREIEDERVVAFDALCCSASLAVAPRAPNEVLVVFTERRPGDGHPGRGRVALYRWTGDAFSRVANWAGNNDETPPAWVTDPTASP